MESGLTREHALAPFFPPLPQLLAEGVRGNPLSVDDPPGICVRCPAHQYWHRAEENESSTGQPPHPRPFSPGKPGGEGRKKYSSALGYGLGVFWTDAEPAISASLSGRW